MSIHDFGHTLPQLDLKNLIIAFISWMTIDFEKIKIVYIKLTFMVRIESKTMVSNRLYYNSLMNN